MSLHPPGLHSESYAKNLPIKFLDGYVAEDAVRTFWRVVNADRTVLKDGIVSQTAADGWIDGFILGWYAHLNHKPVVKAAIR